MAKTKRTINPDITVKTNNADAFIAMTVLSKAINCAYCSSDDAAEHEALIRFRDAMKAAIVAGVLDAAKKM